MPNSHSSNAHPLASSTTKFNRTSFALTDEQLDTLDTACERLGGWSRSMLIRHLAVTGARTINASPTLGPDGLLAGIIPSGDALPPRSQA